MSSKIDRRIARTKDSIFGAFISLIAEKNFEDITINEIAERANVNRGTVYFHYHDKYDLLDKCIEQNLNKMITVTTTTNTDGETIDLIQNSFLPVILYFEENHSFYAAMLSNKGVPSFRDRMLELVTTHMNIHINMDGDNKNYSKEFMTQFMAAAFVGTIEWWIVNNMPLSANDIAEQLWGVLIRNQVIS